MRWTRTMTREQARLHPASITFLRLPRVQPVHGRNCICHACQPGALGRFPEDRVNAR